MGPPEGGDAGAGVAAGVGVRGVGREWPVKVVSAWVVTGVGEWPGWVVLAG